MDSPRGSKVIYFGFMLLGLGSLFPCSFFITADYNYWQYKFRNVSSSNDLNWEQESRTPLQLLFSPLQVLFTQLPAFLFLVLNVVILGRIPQRLRLLGSIVCMMLFFIITAVLTKVVTDHWQNQFFALTLWIILILSSSQAVLQGSLSGLA